MLKAVIIIMPLCFKNLFTIPWIRRTRQNLRSTDTQSSCHTSDGQDGRKKLDEECKPLVIQVGRGFADYLPELSECCDDQTVCTAKSVKRGVTVVTKGKQTNSILVRLRRGDQVLEDQCQLVVGPSVGSGLYGTVYSCSLGGNMVATKVIRRAGDRQWIEQALDMLRDLGNLPPHPNLLLILGVGKLRNPIHDSLSEILTVMEYCPRGDLRSFLEIVRKRGNFHQEYKTKLTKYDFPDPGVVTMADLLEWAAQLACGMNFLSSKNIAHGALSLKQVLLSVDRVAKISDYYMPNLRKDFYTTDKLPPWRHLAPEVLFDPSKVGDKSDVWSFGITLWEMFTLGGIPFGSQLLPPPKQLIKNGSSPPLPRPKHATDEMYEIISSCCSVDPQKRPLFQDLEERLSLLSGCSGGGAMESQVPEPDLYQDGAISPDWLEPSLGEVLQDGPFYPASREPLKGIEAAFKPISVYVSNNANTNIRNTDV